MIYLLIWFIQIIYAYLLSQLFGSSWFYFSLLLLDILLNFRLSGDNEVKFYWFWFILYSSSATISNIPQYLILAENLIYLGSKVEFIYPITVLHFVRIGSDSHLTNQHRVFLHYTQINQWYLSQVNICLAIYNSASPFIIVLLRSFWTIIAADFVCKRTLFSYLEFF